jgi:phosphoglycolate phosphatase-like HAD superfamily hydrolase
MSNSKGIIVDVDGTLAIMNGRGPFEWTKVYQDKVNEPVADLVRRLKTSGLSVIIVTGRDGVALEDTKRWLIDNSIPFDEIFSRPVRNFEKDSIIKRRIYDTNIRDRWDIQFVLDDRNQVVKMWREELGIPVFQVADGDF